MGRLILGVIVGFIVWSILWVGGDEVIDHELDLPKGQQYRGACASWI